MPARNFDEASRAWELYADELANYPGVIAVSSGYRIRGGKMTDEPVVTVTVVKKVSESELAPSSVCPPDLLIGKGVRVGVDVVEDPAGYPELQQDTTRYRPVPGGCSMGRATAQNAGTLGGWFCVPNASGSGFDPVWLTNTHVVSGTLNTIPTDSRVVQPGRFDDNTAWAANVIGRTTQITGFNTVPVTTTPPPNAGNDAAIGTIVDAIDPDYQVLGIAPAPFEVGSATVGLGVQKRGRTTQLTNGTVAGTGTNPFTTVNVTYNNATVWARFGSPGNTPVFRISSSGLGIANAFSLAGDSGSLIFDTAPGTLESTFPAVGLLFAGNGNTVTNRQRSSTWALDLPSVMAQLQLETVCVCVLRAILSAIFGSDARSTAASTAFAVGRADSIMRRFRDKVMAYSQTGRVIRDAVAQTAPDVSRVLVQDEIAFGLAVQLLEPWARASTSIAVLGRELDEATVRTAEELGERLIRLAPEVGERIKPLIGLLDEYRGMPMRKLLGRMRVPRPSKVVRPKK